LLIVVDNDNDDNDNGDKKPSAVERRREENLSSLLEQVDIAGIKINKMALPHHVYAWKEAVTEDEEDHSNIRLTRASCDILLPGPTSLKQVEGKVGGPPYDDLAMEIALPKTFVNSKRTAVRVANIAGVSAANIPAVIGRAAAMSRVSAHRDELIAYKKKTEGKCKFNIKLPFPCDQQFCHFDDFGNNNMIHGMSIATYQHEDPVYQQASQYVWILHIELTAKERPSPGMSSPSALNTFHSLA
jgi:hypothetical protein